MKSRTKLSRKINSVLPHLHRLYTAISVPGMRVIFTSLIVTALLMGVRQLGWLQVQELWAFDQLIRLRPDEGSDRRLLIVAVTEQDIQAQRKWPLSDRTIEQLLAKLEQHQPRAIGLDIYRDLPVAPGNTELVKRLQQSDRIITGCKVNDSSGNLGVAPPPGIPEERVGFIDLPIDGGILRRTLLFMNPPHHTAKQNPHLCANPNADIYSFSLLLALSYLELEKIEPENTPSGELKLGSTVFKRLKQNSGGYRNINSAGYQILLNYRSPQKVAKQVTLTEVLTGKVNPDLIKNRIVLIGTTAESINDVFFTPYSAGLQKDKNLSGVEIHAQEVSKILSAVLDRRPLLWYWSTWGETIWIGAWSLFGGILTLLRHPLNFTLTSAAALLSNFIICFGFFLQGAWIPLIPSVFAFTATVGSIIFVERGYTQTIYTRVKSALKIDIEINHSKKEYQVAEITQTEYFQNLKQKGKDIRNKKTNTSPQTNPNQTNNPN